MNFLYKYLSNKGEKNDIEQGEKIFQLMKKYFAVEDFNDIGREIDFLCSILYINEDDYNRCKKNYE